MSPLLIWSVNKTVNNVNKSQTQPFFPKFTKTKMMKNKYRGIQKVDSRISGIIESKKGCTAF
jgi:hypothetical protein